MKRNGYFIILCAVFYAFPQLLSAQEASCSDLTSAIDQNYCRSIESSSMLPSLTSGVSGSICEFEQKREPCQYSVPHPAAVERILLVRKDHHWWDHEIQPHCEALASKYSSPDTHVTRVTFSEHEFGNDCYERKWTRKCVKWIKKVYVTCTLERKKTNYDPHSDLCPMVQDFSRPKVCAAAYQSDADDLDRRRIELETMLAIYQREADLYKNLEKETKKLLDAKKKLIRFEYSHEDMQMLRELSHLLIEKTATYLSLHQFEETVFDVLQIIENLGPNIPTDDEDDVTHIQAQLQCISKESKGKQRVLYLLNIRLLEINQRLAEVQSHL